ncbi:MAG: hypothetical protein WDZ51_08525 [Pirellulaceae bacterium]
MLPRILLIITVLGVGLGLLFGTAVTSAENTESQDTEVRKLLLQKRDILQQQVKHFTQAHLMGKANYGEVLDAQMEVLGVELELAGSKADRIAVLESRVKNRQVLEVQMESQFRTGGVTQDKILTAKTEQIDAQIALLREKARE